MLNYFRRLKFTTKILVLSFFSILVLLLSNLALNILFFGVLGQSDLSVAQDQIFATIDLLSLVALVIFGIFGFHFLLSEMVNFPYSEHKMEVAAIIFLVIFLLMFVPVTLATSQFRLSYSIKTILDIIFLLIGSIYIVLATSIYYITNDKNVLTRRFTRWSVFIFAFFFAYPVLAAVNIDQITLLTFTGAYILGIVLVIIKDVQSLLSSNAEQRENKTELLVFILVLVFAMVIRSVDLLAFPILPRSPS